MKKKKIKNIQASWRTVHDVRGKDDSALTNEITPEIIRATF